MNEKKQNTLLIIIAICSFAFAGNANSINNPCLPSIYAEFTEGSEFLKSFIVSGPMIVALPFILLMGKIADKLNKKTIILAFLALYLVGGIGGAFAPTLAVYAICRAIVGVAMGVTSTLMMGIIFTLFTDLKEKSRVMGLYQGMTRAVAVVVPIVAGFLCLKGWRTAAWLNAIAIVAFVCILLFLPKEIKAQALNKKENTADVNHLDEKVDIPRIVFALCETFLLIVFGWVFFYYNSLYVAERGIGTSVLAGGLSSILTVASVVLNLFLAQVTTRLKRYTAVTAGLVMSGVYILLGFNVSVWVVFILAIFYGFGAATISSYSPILVNEHVPASKTTFYQSIYSCVSFAAWSTVSYIPNFYRKIFEGITWQKIMATNGVVYLALSLLIFVGIKFFVTKKKKTMEQL